MRFRFLIAVVICCLAGFAQDTISVDAKPANPAPLDASEILKVGHGVTAPKVISTPDPEYSEEARKGRVEGMVRLWVVINKDGTVRETRVTKSLDPSLDQKAMDAVQKWKFEPATRDGQPVAVQIDVEVNFRLYDKKHPPKAGDSAELTYNETEIGMRIRVAEGWRLQTQKPPAISQPAVAVFHKPGTLANLTLVREHLESPPELYAKLMTAMMEKRDSLRRLKQSEITLDGIPGTRWELTWNESGGITQHSVFEFFTSGDQHFRLMTTAPEEVYSHYSAEFEQMLGSVQFPLLHATAQDLVPESKN